MNRTVFHGWAKEHPLSARDDSPVPSSWDAEAMEWEVSLLLPQLIAAPEHSSGLVSESTYESVNRLPSAWRALRTTVGPSIRRRCLLLAN